MTTHVILHVRGKPGTAEELLQAVHDIGRVRAGEPGFHRSQHYVDNLHPEHIVVQTWDSAESQKAFMAKIRTDFEHVFAMLAGPPDVTFADEH